MKWAELLGSIAGAIKDYAQGADEPLPQVVARVRAELSRAATDGSDDALAAILANASAADEPQD